MLPQDRIFRVQTHQHRRRHPNNVREPYCRHNLPPDRIKPPSLPEPAPRPDLSEEGARQHEEVAKVRWMADDRVGTGGDQVLVFLDGQLPCEELAKLANGEVADGWADAEAGRAYQPRCRHTD